MKLLRSKGERQRRKPKSLFVGINKYSVIIMGVFGWSYVQKDRTGQDKDVKIIVKIGVWAQSRVCFQKGISRKKVKSKK